MCRSMVALHIFKYIIKSSVYDIMDAVFIILGNYTLYSSFISQHEPALIWDLFGKTM